MESDTKANIDSDHYPVIGTFKTKPRGISTPGKHRSRFKKCTEEEIIGKHTMHEDSSAINAFTAGMHDNRERIIELAKTYNLIAMNTRFRKRPEKNSYLQKNQRN